jgi:hypothetical protein
LFKCITLNCCSISSIQVITFSFPPENFNGSLTNLSTNALAIVVDNVELVKWPFCKAFDVSGQAIDVGLSSKQLIELLVWFALITIGECGDKDLFVCSALTSGKDDYSNLKYS